nr:pyruvate, phosphate dikinase regulatory protein, chloroplastic [Tanacetum cinerariifolium]
MIENKVITKPIDYAILNQFSTDFNTRFMPQTESYAEQAFWSQYSVQTNEPNHSGTTIVEVPKELPKVSMEKDTVILKLKEKLKSFSGDVKERKVEREVEEIETQNLELDHKVTKLAAENEHLKQTYKQLFDSIKSSRVQSKVQCDDLINKVNLKSVEVADLNASLQEKVLVITALKEHLKGKAVLTEVVSLNPIDPTLLQVEDVLLVPKLRKNRTAHIDYIRHTQEEAPILRELVESKRLLSPLNTSLAYASLVSSASGSKSQDNTKKNRIRRTQKKAKETELEDHLRNVKSSLNKASVVDSRATSS